MNWLILVLIIVIVVLLCRLWEVRKILDQVSDAMEKLFSTGKTDLHYQDGDSRTAGINNQLVRLEGLMTTDRRNSENELSGKTRFIENMAHQMKNSAAVMQIQLDLLEGECASSSAVEECQNSLDRLDGELNYILRSCQLAAGKTEMEFAPCDPGELMKETAENLTPMAEKREISLQVEAVNPCQLVCDRFWVGQGLENLLKNAIEHSTMGGQVTLRLENGPGWIWLIVEDSGPGISEEDLRHVFTRYYRGSTRRNGYGLGLNMARDIARAHHGNLTAENRPEGGARFVMSLPLMDGAEYYGDF